MDPDVDALRDKFRALQPILDERTRRLWAGVEARALGRGGISAVARATGMSRTTVRAGLRELTADGTITPHAGIRKSGGGRKSLADRDPDLVDALQRKLDPVTSSDSQGALSWTCRSTARLAADLRAEGHAVSERSVNRLLHGLGYDLQSNWKGSEGRQHPDRDAQFQHISQRVAQFQAAGQPVVAVDADQKELTGPFRNGKREWHPEGKPEKARMHDIVDEELGKVTRYGVYDVTPNCGWVSVGVDHDTARFAVESLRRWWRAIGRAAYPAARRLLVIADNGSSNSSRGRLLSLELQELADELRLCIAVSHFPLGTSKWNNVEHRMVSHVTENWRGRPLVSRVVVVNLIGTAKTAGSFEIRAEVDEDSCATGRNVRDGQLANLDIDRDEFHGEWNYTLNPRPQNE